MEEDILNYSPTVMFRGTPCMIMPGSQHYPWNRYRINNVEEIVVFLVFKVFMSDKSFMFFCSRNEEKTQLKILSFPTTCSWFVRILSLENKYFLPRLEIINIKWIMQTNCQLKAFLMKINPTTLISKRLKVNCCKLYTPL